jgi:hypothetical protein
MSQVPCVRFPMLRQTSLSKSRLFRSSCGISGLAVAVTVADAQQLDEIVLVGITLHEQKKKSFSQAYCGLCLTAW